MKKEIIIGLFFFLILFFTPRAGISELYQYVDKKGVVHFTDRPDQVPEEYRDQLKPVEDRIMIESKQKKRSSFFLPRKKIEINWQDFVIWDSKGKAVGLKQNKLLGIALIQSYLWLWILMELVLSVLAIVLLVIFQNWPTQKGRRRSSIIIIINYFILAPLILFLFVFPSARNFINISRDYLAEIKTNLSEEPALQEMLENLELELEKYQDKLP